MEAIPIAIIVLLSALLIAAIVYAVMQRRKAGVMSAKYQVLDDVIAIQKLFLKNMSHQVRTPLNAISGFSQILSDPMMMSILSEEERREYGRIIQSNTELFTSLVDDILDLGSMNKGKYHLNIAPCKVNETCRKAISSVLMRCPDGVKMYMTSDVDDDFTVTTDGKRMQQVMMNYLTNSVKHTFSGEIHLHATKGIVPGMLTLSVTDTGDGVPVEQAEEIFSRFEHLHDNTMKAGIGLAICRVIAKQLHGEVKLDTSYQGKGARFIFNVPLETPAFEEDEE